jgi:hypothetical protein
MIVPLSIIVQHQVSIISRWVCYKKQEVITICYHVVCVIHLFSFLYCMFFVVVLCLSPMLPASLDRPFLITPSVVLKVTSNLIYERCKIEDESNFIRLIFAFRQARSWPLGVLRIFKDQTPKVFGIRFVCTK